MRAVVIDPKAQSATVETVVPLEAVLEAHAQLAASSAIGKVVLQP